ncbi:MAG: hypothetical protein HKN32_02930 [Flavobacteriales bacterium]|nr:hypothetical protein [Flavobacteriales bacterium]
MPKVNWNLWKNVSLLLISFTCLFFSSCSKPSDDSYSAELGYDYFPNVEGSFKEYAVDSTHYGITQEDFSFFLREEITESFIDGEGQTAMRVERSKRNNPNEDWVLTDVWTQKRTTTSAQRFEENRRFIRLIFPITEEKTWDGNAYNDLDEWTHSYLAIDEAYTIDSLDFGETVTIEQRNNVNLVDQEEASEVYARSIGLIYKYFKDLNFQEGQVTGVEMEMKLVSYGGL